MIGPDIPAHLLARAPANDEEDSDTEAGPAPPPASIGPEIPSSIGPQIPASVSASRVGPSAPVEAEEEEEDYAPALPPHLAAAREVNAKRVIGPARPTATPRYEDEDDDDDDVGPMPLPAGVALYEKDGVEEFLEREERRRKNIEVRAWLSL